MTDLYQSIRSPLQADQRPQRILCSRKKSWTIAIALMVLSTGLSGCGGPKIPPLAKVTGTVTYQGKPLTSGTIQFIPDSEKGTSGRMAIGGIESNGKYELTSLRHGDGAQIGHYIVVIQSFAPTPPATTSEPPAPKALIPLKYTEPTTSDLRAEVKAGTQNEISFDLE